MKLLQLDSSARHNSISRQLTARFAQQWRRDHPNGEVVWRDLTATNLPPISDEWTRGAFASLESRTAEQRAELALSDTLIDELVSADVIVIGAPMYNFTISAPLKAWIDQIVRPGRTVHFGADGAQGLLTGKSVIVLTSRGGAYSNGSPRANFDYQEPYLRQILTYIGLRNVTFIHAENQQRQDQAEESRNAALAQINGYLAAIGSPGK